MRVRSFTQDDAHIFMREDQVTDEIQGVMRLIGILLEHYAGALEENDIRAEVDVRSEK